ncbi:substrate-binding and VWA domain-containing protein [Amycolatopsis taiwanensis]|uniref:VWFA domain-containing protein n=1 Tax=Amycolatopsis taiwanensis TaxID=342230 RepID=A0A9W6R502_9PSEU|nr:substrate-binding and VWA domain-containing protein [Amycolatopsis taiwanensis]GLY69363.1 hypothetical protein Atai01_59820 [Amycolatopsis taiwanensis]
MPFLVAGVMVVTAVAVLFTVVRGANGPAGCHEPTDVRVVAAPEIAEAVREVGRSISAADECYRFRVDARDPGAIEGSVSSTFGNARPDVWIPESSLRLRRALAAGAGDLPASGSSVANSAVVFAVTEQAAAPLGWPGRTPSWADVLNAGEITLGMPDPARDPVGVSALLGVQQSISSSNLATAYAATLRRLSPNTLPAVEDLYSRLPGAGSSKAPVDAFPTSENSLLQYNMRNSAAGRQERLVAVYPPKPIPSLDYPFTILSGPGTAQREGAGKLLSALLGPDGQTALGETGFRGPDGRALRNPSPDERVSVLPQAVTRMPGDGDLDTLLNQWAKVNQSSRARVLIDVSGSMNALVPKSGGKTRLQLSLDAAARGLNLFKPTSEVSVWTFSTNLHGDKDYREIVPMSEVGKQLTNGSMDRIRAIRATPNGGTGLYDSVLAAYQRAREEWEPGKLNLVIVLTDGHNDDPHGITRGDLLTQLSALADRSRPVEIIGIGLGPDVDRGELTAITDVTGGKTFITPDPAKISDVFYSALAALSDPGQ